MRVGFKKTAMDIDKIKNISVVSEGLLDQDSSTSGSGLLQTGTPFVMEGNVRGNVTEKVFI